MGLGVGVTLCVAGNGSMLAAGWFARAAVGTIRAIAATAPPTAVAARRRRIERALRCTSASAERGAVHRVRVVAQLATQVGGQVVVVHRSSSGPRGSRLWGVRVRSAASARLVWDFTVPTEMPSAAAVSASVSSS